MRVSWPFQQHIYVMLKFVSMQKLLTLEAGRLVCALAFAGTAFSSGGGNLQKLPSVRDLPGVWFCHSMRAADLMCTAQPGQLPWAWKLGDRAWECAECNSVDVICLGFADDLKILYSLVISADSRRPSEAESACAEGPS